MATHREKMEYKDASIRNIQFYCHLIRNYTLITPCQVKCELTIKNINFNFLYILSYKI